MRLTELPEADREAGGVLLGRYRNPHIEIMSCTTPLPEDLRTRFGFVRQDKGHQKAAIKEWLESGGSINFVGEWHTHLERFPTPSWVDRRSWRKQMRKHNPDPMVFVIAGARRQRQAIDPVKSPYLTTEGPRSRRCVPLDFCRPPHLKVLTARGPGADQRSKLLIYQAMEGPILDAYLNAFVSAMDYKTTS